MFVSLNKYYKPLSREEFEDMDLTDFRNAVKVAMAPQVDSMGHVFPGMPEALTKQIWKKSADEDFVEMYKNWKMKGKSSGL